MNSLKELLLCGQSYWLDNLTRKKITGGELKKRVTEEGLRGITSNPSIFNKAISGSNDYDDQIKELVVSGKNPQQVYEALTVKDVQDACDILKIVYDESNGSDGFVSLEVSPFLARDTEGTMIEARRLFALVGRKNCMIKIPGTAEGLPAIEQMLYEGININITLLFSIERYVEVAKAYIQALQRRAKENKPVNDVHSVASFFLSRIDILADQLIAHKIITTSVVNEKNNKIKMISGKTGIASAVLAYQEFKKIFNSTEWKKLSDAGAAVQKPLWASTSNKDPLYQDLRYVEKLVGDDTVNTLPDETIAAYAVQGHPEKNAIDKNTDEANNVFRDLRKAKIDIDFITQQLENEGIQKFNDAYNKLMSALAEKIKKASEKNYSDQKIVYKDLKEEIYTSLDDKLAGRRLFNHDPYLWKSDAADIKSIENRLGWLTLPSYFYEKSNELVKFGEEIKSEGYKHIVLLGMGGSSLCSEVAKETFGSSAGFPELLVLDNTGPDAIRDVENKIDVVKTLFIVASKSGTTKEPLAFFRYFYNLVSEKIKDSPGKNFITITDDKTLLVNIASEFKFRKVFINPGDIGGRYSVLSYFGILPMALIGIDIKALLKSAMLMQSICNPEIPAAANPGIALGAALGFAQRHGRDKVTFVLPPTLKSFGLWAEQLLAESTGKEGKGLIPVSGEETGLPESYGNDRIFISITDEINDETENSLNKLSASGSPVIHIKLNEKYAIGGEFYRWEIATAIAGMIIGINSFDEPNVAESKNNSIKLLEEFSANGLFNKPPSVISDEKIKAYAGDKFLSNEKNTYRTIDELISAFTSLVKPGDYVALLPYFLQTPHRDEILLSWRMDLRDRMKVATTAGYGPRYLHSTGQLHKGGPASGLYIILTGQENELPIPGEKYGFAVFREAQALGDFRSLNNKGRRVLYIDLGNNIDASLNKIMPAALHADQ